MSDLFMFLEPGSLQICKENKYVRSQYKDIYIVHQEINFKYDFLSQNNTNIDVKTQEENEGGLRK